METLGEFAREGRASPVAAWSALLVVVEMTLSYGVGDVEFGDES